MVTYVPTSNNLKTKFSISNNDIENTACSNNTTNSHLCHLNTRNINLNYPNNIISNIHMPNQSLHKIHHHSQQTWQQNAMEQQPLQSTTFPLTFTDLAPSSSGLHDSVVPGCKSDTGRVIIEEDEEEESLPHHDEEEEEEEEEEKSFSCEVSNVCCDGRHYESYDEFLSEEKMKKEAYNANHHNYDNDDDEYSIYEDHRQYDDDYENGYDEYEDYDRSENEYEWDDGREDSIEFPAYHSNRRNRQSLKIPRVYGYTGGHSSNSGHSFDSEYDCYYDDSDSFIVGKTFPYDSSVGYGDGGDGGNHKRSLSQLNFKPKPPQRHLSYQQLQSYKLPPSIHHHPSQSQPLKHPLLKSRHNPHYQHSPLGTPKTCWSSFNRSKSRGRKNLSGVSFLNESGSAFGENDCSVSDFIGDNRCSNNLLRYKKNINEGNKNYVDSVRNRMKKNKKVKSSSQILLHSSSPQLPHSASFQPSYQPFPEQLLPPLHSPLHPSLQTPSQQLYHPLLHPLYHSSLHTSCQSPPQPPFSSPFQSLHYSPLQSFHHPTSQPLPQPPLKLFPHSPTHLPIFQCHQQHNRSKKPSNGKSKKSKNAKKCEVKFCGSNSMIEESSSLVGSSGGGRESGERVENRCDYLEGIACDCERTNCRGRSSHVVSGSKRNARKRKGNKKDKYEPNKSSAGKSPEIFQGKKEQSSYKRKEFFKNIFQSFLEFAEEYERQGSSMRNLPQPPKVKSCLRNTSQPVHTSSFADELDHQDTGLSNQHERLRSSTSLSPPLPLPPHFQPPLTTTSDYMQQPSSPDHFRPPPHPPFPPPRELLSRIPRALFRNDRPHYYGPASTDCLVSAVDQLTGTTYMVEPFTMKVHHVINKNNTASS